MMTKRQKKAADRTALNKAFKKATNRTVGKAQNLPNNLLGKGVNAVRQTAKMLGYADAQLCIGKKTRLVVLAGSKSWHETIEIFSFDTK